MRVAVTFGDFSGGLATDPPASKLANNEFRRLKNVLINARGDRLYLRSGQRPLLPTLSGETVLGFTRATLSGASYLVYARSDGAVIAYNEDTTAQTTLVVGSGTVDRRYEFARFSAFGRDRVIWADGESELMEWTGSGAAGLVGLAVPSGAPTANKLPSGALDTKDDILPPIQYYITFGTPTGEESNPSPKSNAVSGRAFSVDLDNIPVSLDSRVDRRYIYRVGGELSRPTRVDTLMDNTSTQLPFGENLPDADVGTIQISFRRDRPPAGVSLLAVNKSRVIAVKGFDVYVSSLARPWYFPTYPDDVLIDGRQIPLDPDPKNEVVGLGSTGSAIVIAREQNQMLLTGDDADAMALSKIADVGCVSGRTLAVVRNLAFWLGPDATVWSLGQGEPEPISRQIERTLRATSLADRARACACHLRDHYVLCIPQGSGNTPLVLAYGLKTRHWLDLSEKFLAATQLYGETGQGDLDELLFATEAGFTNPSSAAYAGIVAALGADTGDFTPDIESGEIAPFGERYRSAIDRVRVEGLSVPVGGSLSLTLTSITGTGATVTRSYPLRSSASSAVLLETRVSADLSGRWHTWRITGAPCSAFELDTVSLEFVRKGGMGGVGG